MIPTTAPSLTTGKAPTFFADITTSASNTVWSHSMVWTSWFLWSLALSTCATVFMAATPVLLLGSQRAPYRILDGLRGGKV